MMAKIFGGATPRDTVSSPDRYPVGVPRRLAYPNMPAWGLLDRAASLIPGRAACVYNSVEWTWEELNLAAIRTAAALHNMGVEPGDRVGVLLPNIPEYIIALNGIWRADAIAVALSPMAVPEEVDRMLEATDCKVVICLDMLVSLISGEHRPKKTLLVSLRPQLPLFEQLGYLFLRKRRTGLWWMSATEHVGWFWEEISLECDDSSSLPLTSLESAVDGQGEIQIGDKSTHSKWATAPAYILPTGGTTGEPKAVTLSHRNMVANAWQQYYWAGAAVGQEKLLAVLPFFHSYGLSTNVMGGAAMVATLVMDHRFNVRKAIRLIEEHRPTVFHAVPAMLVAMNEHLRTHKADLTSLKWVISGGAPLPEAVGREFAEHSKALVVEGYGLSEASPVTHVGPLDGNSSYGTIGMPLPDTECRIVDSETGETEMAPGEVGELLVRGPQVMLGYWKNDGASFTDIGWLHTGDLARLTPDGLYQIVERKKDLIITSGFNVYPQEVELVLKRHPSVKDAAVVGEPDERKGEIVKAFVVLNDGAKFDEAQLKEFCHEHLAAHKRPAIIEHCKDDLPRSFLGKVIRRKLRGEQS
ncbi:MAG: AMP-binding protein [Planctomycetaceae bacterium]